MNDPVAHAQAFLEHNRPEQALALISPHLAAAPDDVEALNVATLALIGVGDLQGAAATARHAVEVAPDASEPWMLLSAALIGIEDGPGAQRAAGVAVSLAPQSWAAHAQSALADVAAQSVSTASLEQARLAIELGPEESQAHFAHAEVASALKQKKTARESYHRALALDPHDIDVRNNLAVSGMRTNLGQSAASFIDILAQGPTSPLALHNLKAAVTSAMRSVHLIVWGVWFIAFQTTRLTDFAESPAGQLTRAGFAVLCCVVVAAYVLRLRSGAGAHFPRFAATVVSFDRAVNVWLGLLVFVIAVMIFGAIAPIVAVRIAYGLALIALVIGMILSHRIAKRLRASAPSPLG